MNPKLQQLTCTLFHAIGIALGVALILVLCIAGVVHNTNFTHYPKHRIALTPEGLYEIQGQYYGGGEWGVVGHFSTLDEADRFVHVLESPEPIPSNNIVKEYPY